MFTFNGQGEYTLVTVKETGFILQGRTGLVSSMSNQATQFTAFAFGVPFLDVVEVYKSNLKTNSLSVVIGES